MINRTARKDIIQEMQSRDHVKDCNTPTRCMFRCYIDGSYLGNGHYKSNCAFVSENFNNDKKLISHAISEFTKYMALDHDCSYSTAQRAIVISLPKETLTKLNIELIDDYRDLVRELEPTS